MHLRGPEYASEEALHKVSCQLKVVRVANNQTLDRYAAKILLQ